MVSKSSSPSFERHFGATLAKRLNEPRRFVQVLAGPRQVGKTTLVRQVLARSPRPSRMVSADEPALRDRDWLARHWREARELAAGHRVGAVLVLDEVQKIPQWSETVKRLWDEDTAGGVKLKVLVLGSAPLLLQRGLGESLAGRFEILHLPHWSFAEMREAFGFKLDDFLFFGGYPGAAPLIGDWERWRRYVLDALVETTISRDVLLLTRVDKPALLRRLFEIGCRYSGQILSYTKMLGQLQDAGNTVTLAHYLDLLAGAGVVAGLQKYAGDVARSRGSSPKLQVLNTALMTAQSGLTPEEAQADHEFRGRLVESAIGAHLLNAAAAHECEVFYWRERNREVDFVLRSGKGLVGLEVKSGRTRGAEAGLSAFADAFGKSHTLLVGDGGTDLETFLSRPVSKWVRA